jgi:hypothetical protein
MGEGRNASISVGPDDLANHASTAASQACGSTSLSLALFAALCLSSSASRQRSRPGRPRLKFQLDFSEFAQFLPGVAAVQTIGTTV